jgi:hypothetical protein
VRSDTSFWSGAPSGAPRLGEALALESTAETARIGIEGLVVDGPVPMPYKQRPNTIDANVCFNRSFRCVPSRSNRACSQYWIGNNPVRPA